MRVESVEAKISLVFKKSDLQKSNCLGNINFDMTCFKLNFLHLHVQKVGRFRRNSENVFVQKVFNELNFGKMRRVVKVGEGSTNQNSSTEQKTVRCRLVNVQEFYERQFVSHTIIFDLALYMHFQSRDF